MKHLVTERALLGRVNRKLAKEIQFVRIVRENSRGYNELGRYVVCDGHTGNLVSYGDVKLDELARELGAMHLDEVLA